MFRHEVRRVLPLDEAWMALFRAPNLQELLSQCLTQSDRWIRRKRDLGSLAGLIFVLMIVLHRRLSMPNVLMTMAAPLRQLDPRIRVRPVTNEALLKRRKFLGEATLRNLFESTARDFDRRPVFAGRPAHAIDGSKMDVPDTVPNEEAFGRQKASRGHSASPQLRLVTLEEGEDGTGPWWIHAHLAGARLRSLLLVSSKGASPSGLWAVWATRSVVQAAGGRPPTFLDQSVSPDAAPSTARIAGRPITDDPGQDPLFTGR